MINNQAARAAGQVRLADAHQGLRPPGVQSLGPPQTGVTQAIGGLADVLYKMGADAQDKLVREEEETRSLENETLLHSTQFEFRTEAYKLFEEHIDNGPEAFEEAMAPVYDLINKLPVERPEIRQQAKRWAQDLTSGLSFNIRQHRLQTSRQQAAVRVGNLFDAMVSVAEGDGAALDEAQLAQRIKHDEGVIDSLVAKMPALFAQGQEAKAQIRHQLTVAHLVQRIKDTSKAALVTNDLAPMTELSDAIDMLPDDLRTVVADQYRIADGQVRSMMSDRQRANDPVARSFDEQFPRLTQNAYAAVRTYEDDDTSVDDLAVLADTVEAAGFPAEAAKARATITDIQRTGRARDIVDAARRDLNETIDMEGEDLGVVVKAAMNLGIMGDAVSPDVHVERLLRRELSEVVKAGELGMASKMLWSLSLNRRLRGGQGPQQWAAEEEVMALMGDLPFSGVSTSGMGLTEKIERQASEGMMLLEIGAHQHGMELAREVANTADMRPDADHDLIDRFRATSDLLQLPPRQTEASIRRRYAGYETNIVDAVVAVFHKDQAASADIYRRAIEESTVMLSMIKDELLNPSSDVYLTGDPDRWLDFANELLTRLLAAPDTDAVRIAELSNELENARGAAPILRRIAGMSPRELLQEVHANNSASYPRGVQSVVNDAIHRRLGVLNMTKSIEGEERAKIGAALDGRIIKYRFSMRELLDRGKLVEAYEVFDLLNAANQEYLAHDQNYLPEFLETQEWAQGMMDAHVLYQGYLETPEEEREAYVASVNNRERKDVNITGKEMFNQMVQPHLRQAEQQAKLANDSVAAVTRAGQKFDMSTDALQQVVEQGAGNASPEVVNALRYTVDARRVAQERGIPGLREELEKPLDAQQRVVFEQVFDNLEEEVNTDVVGLYLREQLGATQSGEALRQKYDALKIIVSQLAGGKHDQAQMNQAITDYVSSYGDLLENIRYGTDLFYEKRGVFDARARQLFEEIVLYDETGETAMHLAHEIALHFRSDLKSVWRDLGIDSDEAVVMKFMGSAMSEGRPSGARAIFRGYKTLSMGNENSSHTSQKNFTEHLTDGGYLRPYEWNPEKRNDIMKMAHMALVGVEGQEVEEDYQPKAGDVGNAFKAAVGRYFHQGPDSDHPPIEVPRDMTGTDTIRYFEGLRDNDTALVAIRKSLPPGVNIKGGNPEELMWALGKKDTVFSHIGGGRYYVSRRVESNNRGVLMEYFETDDNKKFVLDLRMSRTHHQGSGTVDVVDGDTFYLNQPNDLRPRIRLGGYDADELHEDVGGQRWPIESGERARMSLIDLVGDEQVDCSWYTQDADGRPIGQCHVGTVNINQEMIRRGRSGGWLTSVE